MDTPRGEPVVLSPHELEPLVFRTRAGVDQEELTYWMDRFAEALETGEAPAQDVTLSLIATGGELTLYQGRAMALAALKLQIPLAARVIGHEGPGGLDTAAPAAAP